MARMSVHEALSDHEAQARVDTTAVVSYRCWDFSEHDPQHQRRCVPATPAKMVINYAGTLTFFPAYIQAVNRTSGDIIEALLEHLQCRRFQAQSKCNDCDSGSDIQSHSQPLCHMHDVRVYHERIATVQ